MQFKTGANLVPTTTKVQHLSFEYFTSRGVTLAGAKAANRV